MKRIFTLFVLSVVALGAMAAKPRTLYTPPFTGWSSTTVEIAAVTLSDTATVVDADIFFRPDNWISISGDSYLLCNGKRYPIRSATGVALGQKHWMPKSGEDHFRLVFEPLPRKATSFDLIESDCDDCFKIWGVDLTGKGLPTLELDAQFKSMASTNNAALSKPVLHSGKARVTGRVLDYRVGMKPYVLQYMGLLDDDISNVEIKPDSTGRFDLSIDLPSTSRIALRDGNYGRHYAMLFLSPDSTLTLNINSREIARSSSRLHKKSPSYGQKYYFAGPYADLMNELVQNDGFGDLNNTGDIASQAAGLTTEQYGDRVALIRKQRIEKLEQSAAGPAARLLIRSYIEANAIENLANYKRYMEMAFRLENRIGYRDSLVGYVAPAAPSGRYFDVLRDMKLDNATYYAFSSLDDMGEFIPRLCRLAGVDSVGQLINISEGFVEDMIKLMPYKKTLANFKPLSKSQLDSAATTFYNPLFFDMLRSKNEQIQARIAATKLKTGYEIIDVSHVATDSVLTWIKARHKGKVIFIDLWATWCGPCVSANKAADPVKKEFEGKDVVFVYITDKSSPLPKWHTMIADMKGEHYMVNPEQWHHIRQVEHNFNGVPSYVVVGRDGQSKLAQVGFMGAGAMRTIIEKEL